MECREQVSQFKQEHATAFEKLDLTTKLILDAIVGQRDVFQAAHEAQLTLTKTVHENSLKKIDDARQDVIREIKVMLSPSPLWQSLLTLF